MPDSNKPLIWIGSTLKDLRAFPEEVKDVMGFALSQAQSGGKHPDAKPLKGYKGAGVLEVVDDYDGDTYRAVYTVKLEGVVYALHAFQKKSKTGRATDKTDLAMIDRRLKQAHDDHEQRKERRPMANQITSSSGNVFADLGMANPEEHLLKAGLVSKLAEVIRQLDLSQTAAAKQTGISQPDLSRLLRGRFRDVSADRIIRALIRLGSEVDIAVSREGEKVGEVIHLEPVGA